MLFRSITLWFHRNVSTRLYVTKFLGSEKIKILTLFFQYDLNITPIATSILCLNILFEQYTLALLSFLIHGAYCYNIIQLKYHTAVLPRILFKHILHKLNVLYMNQNIYCTKLQIHEINKHISL